ncbi:MAG: res [Gammaproteobacteria bacterium]|jgi:DNA invertase Pin-like site-specific DNA recombinase|nr:res [Gammaproteobacteria bacterium]
MTIYTYFLQEQNHAAKEAIEQYLQSNHFAAKQVVEDSDSIRVHWHKRAVGHLLEGRVAQPGDSIIVYEASDLARSTCQMLEILVSATAHQVNIHFVKYNEVFHAKEKNKLTDMLRLVHHIENDFISRRTTDALARRRAAGLPLGRPKGRKNKALKLDKYKKDIVKYLDLAISKTSIAKLVGCHPQTLYDWIDRNMIPDRKARKARKPRQSSLYASITGREVA